MPNRFIGYKNPSEERAGICPREDIGVCAHAYRYTRKQDEWPRNIKEDIKDLRIMDSLKLTSSFVSYLFVFCHDTCASQTILLSYFIPYLETTYLCIETLHEL
jgi:hypothetical protein